MHERKYMLDFDVGLKGSQQALAAFSQGELLPYIDKVVLLAPLAYMDHGAAPLEIGLSQMHIDEVLQSISMTSLS